MEELRKLDKVAYIRFASVYKSFSDVEDFRDAIREVRDTQVRAAECRTPRATDHAFMARALALAARGRDTSTPNPSVGCVIVKDGRDRRRGLARARRASRTPRRARSRAASEPPAGATVYVTLEPCSHHGRTPPCAEALVAARVARVVAALEDPNPQVKGRGIAAAARGGHSRGRWA